MKNKKTSTRFWRLQTAALDLAFLPSAVGCVHGAPAERPPNIILILSEDIGYGDAGCDGVRG